MVQKCFRADVIDVHCYKNIHLTYYTVHCVISAAKYFLNSSYHVHTSNPKVHYSVVCTHSRKKTL